MSRPTTRRLQARLREKLDEAPTFGAWSMTGSTAAIEAFAAAGFEWLTIDLQHSLAGPLGADSIADQIRAADAWAMPCVVRVPWTEPASTMQVLDAGAAAVIFPMIDTAEDARRAAAWTRFPPQGVRSWGPVRAAMGDPGYTPASANAAVLVFAMIETAEGFANAREILTTPGIDGVFVGPSDLTLTATGLPRGAETHERTESLIADVLAIAHEVGSIPGISCGSGAEASLRAAQGFRFLPVSSDFGMLVEGAARERAIAMAAPHAHTPRDPYGTAAR